MAPPSFQVYIVESPSFDDLYREKTEGRLIAQGLALADIPTTLRLAGNISLFRKALSPTLDGLNIVDSVHSFIHISSHGTTDGLLLTSGERISWKDFREILVPINTRLNGHLLLCMSSCHGYQAIQTAMTDNELPFCVLIGNKGKPHWSQAAIGYLAFYHVFAQGGTFPVALEAMKKASYDEQFDLAVGQKIKNVHANSILRGLYM